LKKGNILIIENSPGITGALESIISIAKKNSYIYNISFLIGHHEESKKYIKFHGFKVFQLPLLELSKSRTAFQYFPRLWKNYSTLSKIIKHEQIDIIHSNDMYNMLGVLAKIFNSRINLTYHVRLLQNSYAGRLYPIWRFLIEKYADQIICVSNAVSYSFRRDVKIIYDSIEEPELVYKPQKRSVVKLLYLANYTDGKGHDHAIKAFKLAREKIPELEMHMYGGTLGLRKNELYKDSLLKKVVQNKSAKGITINDFVSDKAKVFANSSIFLNFSNSESFSMTTLEALAYGIPAIATDCGGPGEIIEDGVSGRLVPVGDIKAMSEAIIQLAKDPQLRETYSKNGRKRFEEKFNLEEQAKKLEAVYNALLSTATSPRRHEAQESAS